MLRCQVLDPLYLQSILNSNHQEIGFSCNCKIIIVLDKRAVPDTLVEEEYQEQLFFNN